MVNGPDGDSRMHTPAEDHPRPLKSTRVEHVKLRVTLFGVAVGAIGLLLWARFLIVTNHPRTAIAEPPKQVEPADTKNHAPKSVVEAEPDFGLQR